jgi:hypothetical protein
MQVIATLFLCCISHLFRSHRPHQVRITCLRPCQEERTQGFQDHGQASHKQPKDRKSIACLVSFRTVASRVSYNSPLPQTVLWNTVAVECQGDGDLLSNLRIKNVLSGEEKDLPVSGLFYAIGHEPATALVRNQLQVDADGYILTVPGTTQTSVRGVFAAGDVQDKRYRQAITSAGSGCMAALEVEKMLAEEDEGIEG